ncbi:MAG: BON domain-containing protein [Myxococcales bacterium]|jgi:osmotically-inducible protein OsmY
MGNCCSDHELECAARGALRRDIRLADRNLCVRARDGCIELSGLVDGWTTRMRAHAAVQRVARDATLLNQVRVAVPGAARREDGDVRRAVLAALQWHALLPEQAIRVHVARGWVRLCGHVDRAGDRVDAEEAVRHLSNVMGVINELQVADELAGKATDEKAPIEVGAREH